MVDDGRSSWFMMTFASGARPNYQVGNGGGRQTILDTAWCCMVKDGSLVEPPLVRIITAISTAVLKVREIPLAVASCFEEWPMKRTVKGIAGITMITAAIVSSRQR